MEKRRRRKHQSHKRSLVIVNEHRAYLVSTPGGTITVDKLDRAVAGEAAALTDQENSRFEQASAADHVERGRRWLRDAVRHFANVSAVVPPAGGTPTPFDGSRPPLDRSVRSLRRAASRRESACPSPA